MALPAEFDQVTVVGRYVELDGDPVVGYLTFKASPVILKAAAARTIIIPVVLQAVLDANGMFSIALPATNDPDINPGEWTYEVTEGFGPRRVYNIAVDLSLGTTQNIYDLAPITSSTGSYYLQGDRGPAGPPAWVVSGAPPIALGAVGDTAIDPTAGRIYVKSLAGWDGGSSIQGPMGRSITDVSVIPTGLRLTFSDNTTEDIAVDIDVSAHAANRTTHGVASTGVIVGTDDVQTLNNKTLTAPIITGAVSLETADVTGDLGVGGNLDVTGDLAVHDTTGNLATYANVTVTGNAVAGTDVVTKNYADNAGTAAATPSTIMRRDASGNTAIDTLLVTDAPTDPAAATRKDYVDALGTPAATPSTVVRRDGSGNTAVTRLDAAQIAATGPVAGTTITGSSLVKGAGVESTAGLIVPNLTASPGAPATGKANVWSKNDGSLYFEPNGATARPLTTFHGYGSSYPAMPSNAQTGDTFYHQGLGALMSWDGVGWKQETLAYYGSASTRAATATNYGADMPKGFRCYMTDTNAQWVWTGTAFRSNNGALFQFGGTETAGLKIWAAVAQPYFNGTSYALANVDYSAAGFLEAPVITITPSLGNSYAIYGGVDNITTGGFLLVLRSGVNMTATIPTHITAIGH